MNKNLRYGIFVLVMTIGLFLTPYVTDSPDGLEASLEKHSVNTEELPEVIKSPVPGYEFPGIENPFLSVITAGVLGTVITFAAGLLFMKIIKITRTRNND
ncbi:PDGLE domain-containing protein [candidate division KSB1 bacterium]